MEARERSLIARADADRLDRDSIGGKAATSAVLQRAGYPVPPGFCLTTECYFTFVETVGLRAQIQMELARKSLSQMRWEEMWDAALRIRNAFVSADMPAEIADRILSAHAQLDGDGPLAVRSSARGEDGAGRSFAGIHESVVGVSSDAELLDAVKLVWASLWSDAAILYAAELALDPSTSAMAVLVQRYIVNAPSGVAFARDPVSHDDDRCMIEAVPGVCAQLVDGLVEPDRWTLRRSTGEVLQFTAGARDTTQGAKSAVPLLSDADLAHLHRWLRGVEDILGAPPDIEWTGSGPRLTLLQARPITTGTAAGVDARAAYLRLRPSRAVVAELQARVADELVPAIERSAKELADEALDGLGDAALAAAIRQRQERVAYWQRRYDDELIPLAHAVRQFGAYYNDALKPEDPFEFVELLRGQTMIASQRNEALAALADELVEDPSLADAVALSAGDSPSTVGAGSGAAPDSWRDVRDRAAHDGGLAEFLTRVEKVAHDLLNTAFEGERLDQRPCDLLRTIGELAKRRRADRSLALSDTPLNSNASLRARNARDASAREADLFEAVGPARHAEARELLEIARFAWRLRDDDNILLARVEAELLRAVELAATRLRAVGRLEPQTDDRHCDERDADALTDALVAPESTPVCLTPRTRWSSADRVTDPLLPADSLRGAGESARQLIGQPAAPGLAEGPAMRVLDAADLGRFRAGDVLVCDSIQPMMTHLVPLAAAVVERRGGMLIHGAIIARELGIPCVNGVPGAADVIADGDRVSVDGYLGIVTVGPDDLD